jgi:hypothetical protein
MSYLRSENKPFSLGWEECIASCYTAIVGNDGTVEFANTNLADNHHSKMRLSWSLA